MIVFPNAKINIGLNIIEKRTDGFHNIESCFYPVSWNDALEIMPAEHFSFHSSGIPVPGDSAQNLCIKAYDMIAEDYHIGAVDMHLLKGIPIGAGLGGGSADGAFAIKAISQLFNLDISFEKQVAYARRLGSDCAFFIKNKPVYCFSKGDHFEEVSLDLSGKWIVLVNPQLHISTTEAYAGVVPAKSKNDLRDLVKLPVQEWKESIKNDFESSLFPKYSVLPKLKNGLYEHGAAYASMTGSGSTVYGIFEKETDLSAVFAGYSLWQGFLG